MPRSPESFVRARRESWSRLHDLVDKAHKSRLTALTDAELHELGTLYRRTSADLARAQTRYAGTTAGQELVRSLNALALRAHAQIYSAPAPAPVTGWRFFVYGFPQAFRNQWRFILLAAALTFVPAFAAYVCVWTNPDSYHLFLNDEVKAEVDKRAQQKLVTGWGGNTSPGGILGSPEGNSSFIMSNNIWVTVLAVGLGFTAGIGTSVVLVQNGLMLGSLAAVATNDRVDLLWWAVILPHGIWELSAICVAGGAGLLLARSIYAPGHLPRRDAIKIAGAEATKLMAGVVVMLVFAGLIEGFFTPTNLPPTVKLTFAGATALLLVSWITLKPRQMHAG